MNTQIAFPWRLPLSAEVRSHLMRVAIVVSAALLSVGAGIAIGSGQYILAGLFAIPTVLLLGWVLVTHKFELMVLALPLTALIAPIDIPTGTYSRIPISLLLTLILCTVWFTTLAIRKSWSFAPSLMNRPALVFCVACLISYGWSSIWRDPIIDMGIFGNFATVQIASLLTFYASFGAALLIGNFAQSESRLKYIFFTFIVFGTLMTIVQFLKIDTRNVLTIAGLWSLWLVLPAFCYVIFYDRAQWFIRIGLLCIIALNLYQTAVVNLQWKSGWIPTLVGMYIAVFFRSKKWFVVLLLCTAVAAYVGRAEILAITQAEEEEGADQRIGMWEINLRVIGDHWLLGTGPAGYAVYYMTYYPDDARSTHNNYLDIIAQFGIIGSLAWIWFVLATILEGLRQIKQSPPGFLQVVAYTATSGWMAAQASMILGDWILPFAYNQTITGFKFTVFSWIFLGMLIAVRAINSMQKSAPSKERYI
jgi:O-antigen ligase